MTGFKCGDCGADTDVVAIPCGAVFTKCPNCGGTKYTYGGSVASDSIPTPVQQGPVTSSRRQNPFYKGDPYA